MQPTTIHNNKFIMKEMQRSAEIVIYVGYVDLNTCNPVGITPFDFKQSLYDSFAAGLTFAQMCAKHQNIAKCMLAAPLLCQKNKNKWAIRQRAGGLKEKSSAWCGRTCLGVLRCRKGEWRVAINVMQIFFKKYLSRELHERIKTLAFFDFIVYTQHNMQTTDIKPNLASRYSTGLFAFILDV